MATYTDQQILDALRTAYFNLATSGAQSYVVMGRTFTRLDMDQLAKGIANFESRVAAASQPGIGGGTLLVKMGQPR